MEHDNFYYEVGLPLTPVSDATIGAYSMRPVTRDW